MPTYFIVSGQNEVFLRSNSPTAAAIESTLRNIPLLQARSLRLSRGEPDPGGFVGPSRIVRRAYLLPPGGRITTFSWLYELPDPPAPNNTPQKIATRANDIGNPSTGQLVTQVSAVLRAQSSDWSNISVAPYNPASNGTIGWWASGEASHTATRDEFALTQQVGQNETVDAPAGPTGQRPPSVGNPLNLLPSSKSLIVMGAIGLGILTLVYVGPVISRMGKRSNPRRRGR